MVLRLGTGRGGYGSAADNCVYCGTGHDHFRAMGLNAVTLDALEPARIARVFHCNALAAMYFDVTSTQGDK